MDWPTVDWSVIWMVGKLENLKVERLGKLKAALMEMNWVGQKGMLKGYLMEQQMVHWMDS
jgi:hypothetical protein